MKAKSKGWIGVDFDKTLSKHRSGAQGLGEPVKPMVNRVKRWLSSGKEVRIVTARPPNIHGRIADWTEQHVGRRLRVTNSKSPAMRVLYDDRVRRVEPNTGRLLDGKKTTNRKSR